MVFESGRRTHPNYASIFGKACDFHITALTREIHFTASSATMPTLLLSLLVLLSVTDRVSSEETAENEEIAENGTAIPAAHAEPAVTKDEAERIVLWKRLIEAGADINR